MLKLKELRKHKGWTQKAVSDMLGIDRTTYAKYESGASEPNFEMLLKLSKLFNISVDNLIRGLDSPIKSFDINTNTNSDDLLEFTKELSQRESMKLLFQQIKDLPDSEIIRLIKIIKVIEDEESSL